MGLAEREAQIHFNLWQAADQCCRKGRRGGQAGHGRIALEPAALPSKRVDIVENCELTQDNAPDHMGRLQVLGVDRRSTGAPRREAIGKVGVVEPDPYRERHRFDLPGSHRRA
jgi:hypothetical protein